MDFGNLFEGFNTQDSYAILFFLIIAYLLGFLTAFLLRGGKIRRLKKEVKTLIKSKNELEAELEAANEQIRLKDADLKKLGFEKEEAEAKADRIEAERVKLFNQLYEANAEIEKLQASNKSYLLTIEELNNQEGPTELESVDDNMAESNLYRSTISRLQIFEEKLNRLESENKILKTELDGLKADGVNIVSTDADDELEDLNLNTEKAVLKGKILLDYEADDLCKIEGIGPFIHQKLNSAGVYTYEQIAGLDSASIEQLTREIGYLPGRIEKDNWVRQAAKLAKKKRKNPAAYSAKPIQSDDNLKKVEGIGPKIEKILKKAGISSWRTLAETPVERLHEILMEAGDRYRMHDPGTWPAQARLAANSDWDLLKDYQDDLTGGRNKKS